MCMTSDDHSFAIKKNNVATNDTTNTLTDIPLEITASELAERLDGNYDKPFMIFDIGDKERYQNEHIPGSKFAVCDQKTINSLLPKLPKDAEIIIVAEEEDYIKNIAKMARDKGGLLTRYLKGGISSWNSEKTDEQDPKITAKELKKAVDNYKVKNGDLFLLDVRESDEFNQWNIEGSINIPLGEIPDSLNKIPKDKQVITICPHGNRSGMVTFMLQRQNYDVKTLEEGLKGWSSTFEYATEEYKVSENYNVKVIQVRKIGKGCMSYIISASNKKLQGATNKEQSSQYNEAIVIDPVYPAEGYEKIAVLELNTKTKITKVFDTHLHADHISAARELAKKTNATIYLSSYEDYSSNAYSNQITNQVKVIFLKEEDNLTVNLFESETGSNKEKTDSLGIQIIHTPGHTAGGLSFLISNKLLFTGDTLFVDSIGRPDLRDKSEEFASMLYDTLHDKIFRINDKSNIMVFPAHSDKMIDSKDIFTADLEDIQNKVRYLNLKKDEFIKKISSITNKTPSQYKEIIQFNKGEKEIPNLDEIKDLEMGPNRCSIS